MQACAFCSVSALDPQAESEGFSHFHLYVCAAFLIKWRKEILSMLDFQVPIYFRVSCMSRPLGSLNKLRSFTCDRLHVFPHMHASLESVPSVTYPKTIGIIGPPVERPLLKPNFTDQRIHHTSVPAKRERSVICPNSLFHAFFRRISTPRLRLWFSRLLFASLSGRVEKGLMNSYLSWRLYLGCQWFKIITFNHLWTDDRVHTIAFTNLLIWFVKTSININNNIYIYCCCWGNLWCDHMKIRKIFKTKIINLN